LSEGTKRKPPWDLVSKPVGDFHSRQEEAMNRITMLASLASFLLLLVPGDRTLFGIAVHAQAPQTQSPQAQSPQSAGAPSIVRVPVPRADQAAPSDMTNHRCHIFPIQEGHGARARGESPIRPDCDYRVEQAVKAFAPTDLSFHGGPVIVTAQHSSIFLNCSLSCWGNPFEFLSNLFIGLNIPFIHVVDQYVNTIASGRYATSDVAIELNGTQPHTLTDSQLRALILKAVKFLFSQGGGGGYHQMYSIFLPQGQNLCFDNSKQCYCPDNNCNGGSFNFCAYHGSFDSTDAVGNPIHVIYQAQPYNDVPGCQVTNGPNGSHIDSTDNVLSHEIFETITDPDLNAWFRDSDGFEIGDICAWNLANPILLNSASYAIQKEYSNQAHECVSVPPTQLVLRKILVHPDIHHLRLFNLQIDGVTVRSNINSGSTGILTVAPGSHKVGETGGTGTPLGAFETVIGGSCAADGTVNLAVGDTKSCTITNYDHAGGCTQNTFCCEPGDGQNGCAKCVPQGGGC
jgi:hypothetical protein